MKRVVLKKINVCSFIRDAKQRAAEDKINAFIRENNLNVVSVSLFIEDEDNYIFTLTCE